VNEVEGTTNAKPIFSVTRDGIDILSLGQL
jgi:hypothetical protein